MLGLIKTLISGNAIAENMSKVEQDLYSVFEWVQGT